MKPDAVRRDDGYTLSPSQSRAGEETTLHVWIVKESTKFDTPSNDHFNKTPSTQ